MKCWKILILLELLFQFTVHAFVSISTIERLYDNLTSGYNPRLRPAYDQSSVIHVYASARPYAAVELSTADQRLTLLIFFTIAWQDQFLTWNATEVAGKLGLKFKMEEIWHPQLMMGPSYSNDDAYIQDDVGQALVFHNGSVLWTPAVAVSVLCVMDITLYPFDSQKCDMSLGVPYALYDEMELHPLPIYELHSSFEANPQWRFLDVQPAVMFQGRSITYTFHFRRRAEFVVYTTIVPLILLSILNACAVLVPVTSGEKGSIAVTLFLSYCVYLAAIGQTLPPNSIESSYLLLYMTVVQILSALAMLYSILETRLFVYGINYFHSCIVCTSKRRHAGSKDTHLQTNDKPNNIYSLTEINGEATTDSIRNASQSDGSENVAELGDSKTTDQDTLSLYRSMDNVAFLLLLSMNVGVVVVFGVMVQRQIP